MPQISARATAFLRTRLSARFNTLLAEVAPAYGVQPFTIDFNSAPKSLNFFLGELDPADLEKTTPYKLPCMCLYTKQSSNQHRAKMRAFSGTVRVNLDVVLSYRDGNAYVDFDALGHAVEDVINTITEEMAASTFCATDVVISRSPVKPGQGNWFQILQCSFLFELDS